MIRLCSLKLVEGHRNRLNGKLEPGCRIEVRRDDADPTRWLFLASHRLVPAPAECAPEERRTSRPMSHAASSQRAARDLLDALGDRPLNDPVDDIGTGS